MIRQVKFEFVIKYSQYVLLIYSKLTVDDNFFNNSKVI